MFCSPGSIDRTWCLGLSVSPLFLKHSNPSPQALAAAGAGQALVGSGNMSNTVTSLGAPWYESSTYLAWLYRMQVWGLCETMVLLWHMIQSPVIVLSL